MKKTISFFLAIVNLIALFCIPVQAADVDVSQYGSATYTTAYYVPSGSNDSSIIAYEQSGDGTESGGYILTYSKASSATSVPADTLITGAGGGLGNVLIANDTYGAKTFHSRYTFVESSSPILLQFQHKNSSNTVTLKDTFTMTNTGVTFGDASVTVAAPYDINIFQNVYTGETVIYVSDQILIDQRDTGENLFADGATYWHKLNFRTTQDDSAFSLVLKNIRHMVYTTDVTLSDVVGYVMNDSGTGDEEPVDPEPEETEVVIPENLQPLADYALEGYFYNQLNNGWAEITTSDETDASGVITSTATSEETIASGKRVATFYPWADTSTIGGSADAYTMHFGVTVNEISDPVKLDYQYRSSSSAKTLLCLSDGKVAVGDSLDAETFVAVQAPYTLNLFMNIQTGNGYIFVNDQLLFEGNMNPNSCTQWREVRVFNLSEATGLKFVTTAANASVYNAEIGIKDVVKAYMGDDALPEEPVEPEEPGDDETGDDEIYDGVTGDGEGVVKDVSEYSSWVWGTYYYVPGSAGNSDYITWSDTDESTQAQGGTHIQTAVIKSGVDYVPSETAAIHLGGSLGNVKLKNNDNYGAKTFHTRFTFVESSSPILLRFQYQTSSNAGSPKDVCTMSNTGVTLDDKTVTVTAPYDINIFQNVDSGVTVIYVNDQILLDQRETAGNMWGSSSHHWQQLRFVTTQDDSAFKLVIQNAHHDIYNEKVLLSDVIEYVMLNDKSQAKETNYWWTIDGIKTEWQEIQGAMDGVCSIIGDNTDGYVLTPNSINESHYGYARYFLGSDDKDPLYTSSDDSVLLQSVEYNPTNLTTGQIFEVRGNNAYQTLWTAHPATETEPAYLSISGNKVVISADKFYKIDFIVNNKDYEYYILVDGKIVGCGTIWATRQPLWQTVFSSYTLEESMTLKNVKTTLFDNSVSINDVVKKLATNVYVDVDGFVYDNDLKTLTATATVVGSETTFDSANLIYAAYTKAGKLISTNIAETNSEAITNMAEYETNYPHGELDVADVAEGEELIIKAYLWDSVSGMTPISNAGQGTYTVPVTVVEAETTTE